MEMSLIQGVKLSSTEAGATTHPHRSHPHRSYCALRELAALLSAFSKPPVSFFVLYAINLAVSQAFFHLWRRDAEGEPYRTRRVPPQGSEI